MNETCAKSLAIYDSGRALDDCRLPHDTESRMGYRVHPKSMTQEGTNT